MCTGAVFLIPGYSDSVRDRGCAGHSDGVDHSVSVSNLEVERVLGGDSVGVRCNVGDSVSTIDTTNTITGGP